MELRAVRQWDQPPRLPKTHYVDNRIYSDPVIFAEEQARIFAGGWKMVCHESELPNSGDYRVFTVAGIPILLVRAEDGEIRAFFNACPHRGAELVRNVQGNAGRRFQCFYHLWTFGLDGRCTGITRPGGYEPCGLKKEDVGLRRVRTENRFGLIFVSMRDDVDRLDDYLGGLLGPLETHLGQERLEIFHYHSAEMNTNWKLWNDNNTELYHELLHVFNRKTSLSNPAYNERRWSLFANGHSMMEQGKVEMQYENWGLEGRSINMMPGMYTNGVVVMTIFPDILINIRATVIRIDTMTPIAPGKTLVEWRGLCLKSDSPEVKQTRARHHNQVWGPAGRNLPEDIAAVESQWRNMANDAIRYSIIAREENLAPQDDANLRAYYQEWGRRVGRHPHDASARSAEMRMARPVRIGAVNA